MSLENTVRTVWKTVVIVRVVMYVTALVETALMNARPDGGQRLVNRVSHFKAHLK